MGARTGQIAHSPLDFNGVLRGHITRNHALNVSGVKRVGTTVGGLHFDPIKEPAKLAHLNLAAHHGIPSPTHMGRIGGFKADDLRVPKARAIKSDIKSVEHDVGIRIPHSLTPRIPGIGRI